MFLLDFFLSRGRQRVLVPLSDGLEGLHGFRALEDPGECVVLLRWYGIELVIMTTGTSKRQPKKRTPQCIDLFVDDVHLHADLVWFGENLRTERQEARGDGLLDALCVVRRRK